MLKFIIIFNVLSFSYCNSQTVTGKADTLFFQGKDLNIVISIFNKSDKEIFIPLTHWIFTGDTIADFLIGPYQTYFVNKISFYKCKYDSLYPLFSSKFSKDFLRAIPSLLEVKSNKSASINLKIQLSDELFRKFKEESFYLSFNIAYGEADILSEIGDIIDCKEILHYPEIDTSKIYISPETRSDICFHFNELINCQLDEKQSEIFALGFLKRINFKVNLP